MRRPGLEEQAHAVAWLEAREAVGALQDVDLPCRLRVSEFHALRGVVETRRNTEKRVVGYLCDVVTEQLIERPILEFAIHDQRLVVAWREPSPEVESGIDQRTRITAL